MRQVRLSCVAIGIWLCSTHWLWADTPAEMLERGIYNEETVGNLDEAIKIYRQVLDVASETERLAANAQFRLAQCLHKQQKTAEAIDAFRKLVEKYPQQEELVAKAKQYLPNAVQFSEAPWKDGERLTLTMKLPGGRPIGIVGVGVDAQQLDGKETWEMIIRRCVAEGQNEGVSRVLVDKSTNRPLKTFWEHTILGSADAVWSDDKVVISSRPKGGQTEQKTIDLDQTAYSNDQWFFGFRQLPLAIGYKVTIPLRIAFTGGTPLDMQIDVKKKETIKTSAGDFECFRLDTNIAQTFWVADVPQRYPVKFEAEGIQGELTSIGSRDQSARVENQPLGYEFTVPAGWFHHALPSSNEDNASAYRVVAPEMATLTISVKDKSLLSDADRSSLQTWADSKIARGKQTYKQFDLRSGSMRDTTMAGTGARNFVVDRQIGGLDFVADITLATSESKALAVAASMPKGDFAKYREQVETFRKSISLR